MPASHTPFAIWNRAVNPFVRGLLRSPLHRLVSGGLALITVTGKKSGRAYTFPVSYERPSGDEVRITVGWPERKLWWRNLRGTWAPVSVRLRGEERTGIGVAEGEPATGVTVRVRLDPV